jgi:hypothetical protein
MTVTHTRTDRRPVKGWRNDPHLNTAQLTHAVLPDRHTALCGVHVTVLGELWPDPHASTPISRCSVCTAAIDMMWTTGHPH